MLTVDPHPLADLAVFVTEFPAPLGSFGTPYVFQDLVRRTPPDDLFTPADRQAVRALLRHGGFKPAGRNKPASEYVQNAIPEGRLGSINAPVDACNVASFVSGLPISVVDLDRCTPPLHIGVAPAGTSYLFNQSGQEIQVDGLLCLFDTHGPCANAVKDSQRTKTHEGTTRTFSVIWGTQALPGRTASTERFYRALLHELGAITRTP